MIDARSFFKFDDKFIPSADHDLGLKGDIDNEFEDFEGAIELIINGVTLIDKNKWDYVDQLWRVLLNGLAYMRLRKHFIGCFPDQAIEIMFVDMNDIYAEIRIKGKVEDRVVVEKEELFNVLLSSAEKFFEDVRRNLPSADLGQDFDYIEAIRSNNKEELLKYSP